MSVQGKKRLKKRGSRKLAPALFVLIGVFSLSVFGVYKLFSKGVASAFSVSSEDLSTQDVYSILYISSTSDLPGSEDLNDLRFFELNPKKSGAIATTIPRDEKIDALGKFGMESITNILSLGRRYSDGDLRGGVEYLVRSLEFDLGIKIDRYIYVKGDSESVMSDLLAGHSFPNAFSPEFLFGIKGDLITNLSSSEFLSSVRVLRNLDVSEVPFGDLEAEVRKFVYNSDISLEGKTVAVLNGTELPGVASFGGRVCENAGMRIIEVGNASRVYGESVLIIDEPESLSAAYLMRFFGFSKIIKKQDLSGFAEPAVDRADITMIIGLDIAGHL